MNGTGEPVRGCIVRGSLVENERLGLWPGG